MEDKILKLSAYLGLVFVIVWAVASALGKRSLVEGRKHKQKAAGSVWARKSVPAVSSQMMAAGIFPTPPVPVR